MKPRDILEHFLSRADWVDRAKTVDRLIVGDPDADFDRCLVTWMPNLRSLRHLTARGLRLLVCHEPTFWNHHDVRPGPDDPVGREKLSYIQDHGITIVRNHDCWDRWPEVGIPWAWAGFLGLGNCPAAVGANGYQHRYDIQPLALGMFARRSVAHRHNRHGRLNRRCGVQAVRHHCRLPPKELYAAGGHEREARLPVQLLQARSAFPLHPSGTGVGANRTLSRREFRPRAYG